MTSAITIASKEERVAAYLNAQPAVTPWDSYLADDLPSGELQRQLTALGRAANYLYAGWVLEKRLELASRRERGESLELTNFTCGSCGTAKLPAWKPSCCLACEDFNAQFHAGDFGNRGRCEWLAPLFLPEDGGWGWVRYEYVGGGHDPLMLPVATGFKSRLDAWRAAYPLIRCHEDFCARTATVCPVLPDIPEFSGLTELVSLETPLDPHSFRRWVAERLNSLVDAQPNFQRLVEYAAGYTRRRS